MFIVDVILYFKNGQKYFGKSNCQYLCITPFSLTSIEGQTLPGYSEINPNVIKDVCKRGMPAQLRGIKDRQICLP